MKFSKNKTFIQSPALFSYRIGNSLIHRLPCILKLSFLSVMCIRLFSNSDYGGFFSNFINSDCILWVRLAFYVIITIFVFFLARTPFSSLKKEKFIFTLGVCLILLYLIPSTAEELINYKLDFKKITAPLLYILRLFTASTAALVVFETSSSLQIYDAFISVENIFAKIFPPIKKLRFAMILSVTVNFIPEIFEMWNLISLAAYARSSNKHRKGFIFLIRDYNARFSALFYNLLQYAEEKRKSIINRIDI